MESSSVVRGCGVLAALEVGKRFAAEGGLELALPKREEKPRAADFES